jgi:hypothetical protein
VGRLRRGKREGVGRLERERRVAAGKGESDLRLGIVLFIPFFKSIQFGPVQSV